MLIITAILLRRTCLLTYFFVDLFDFDLRSPRSWTRLFWSPERVSQSLLDPLSDTGLMSGVGPRVCVRETYLSGTLLDPFSPRPTSLSVPTPQVGTVSVSFCRSGVPLMSRTPEESSTSGLMCRVQLRSRYQHLYLVEPTEVVVLVGKTECTRGWMRRTVSRSRKPPTYLLAYLPYSLNYLLRVGSFPSK